MPNFVSTKKKTVYKNSPLFSVRVAGQASIEQLCVRPSRHPCAHTSSPGLRRAQGARSGLRPSTEAGARPARARLRPAPGAAQAREAHQHPVQVRHTRNDAGADRQTGGDLRSAAGAHRQAARRVRSATVN